jgi:hypothetical protein
VERVLAGTLHPLSLPRWLSPRDSAILTADRGTDVARQRDGATVSPVAWGQARSISDDVEMMVAGAGSVKWGDVAGGVWG